MPIMETKNAENMLKNIFNKVVEIVMDESGLEFDRLAHGRDERSVTARVVLVDALVGIGMSEAIIVDLSGMSQKRVNGLKNAARHRLRGLYGNILHGTVSERIEKALAISE